ncbi:MAG: HAMP domain-containing histidine kinase [Candidatus Riflebacteria bacterium]|nr:HAMP domain-containing histidine kinase [Candidatus Riflebacteria bacterium]
MTDEPQTDQDTSPGTVLVVDDDENLCQLLTVILTLDGYKVLSTNSGREALGIVALEQIDAILLDVRMPDMDGFEVMQELRAAPETANIPILFVTADAIDSESIQRGLDMGARDYIPKPLNKPELLARVASVVRLYRTERELRNSNANLKELDRRRRQYLAMASHDLQVPLLSVDGYCRLLVQGAYGPISADQAHTVGRIRALVHYMKVLVENLLDLEKMQEGSLRLELAPVDPAALVAEAVGIHDITAREKQVHLEAELGSDLDEPALDYSKMLQVLNNLIGNALKFCPAQASVKVGARRDRDHLEMWVADTGPGIPLEEQHLLFQPFRQCSVKPTSRERGAGLGLCIVKGLVELHGGTLAVDSAPGRGSRFTLRLPLSSELPRPD